MRVDLFDFDLPPERIALRPARPRDAAPAPTITPLDLGNPLSNSLGPQR